MRDGEATQTYRSTATASRSEKWPALADALEELAADSRELKSEVAFCPGLEPFVDFDLRGKNKRVRRQMTTGARYGKGGVKRWEETERTNVGMMVGPGRPAFRSTRSPRSP
jgi:hypothetical protein